VKNGTVTAVAEGTAIITATAEDGSGVSASMTVQVIVPVRKITLSETKQLDLAPLVPWRVTAQVEPENATNQEIIWKSSSGKVASVDEHGTITGVSPGTATITAEAADGNGAKAAVKVKVDKYDLVFESTEPQALEYTIAPGSHYIRAKGKTGCVSVPGINMSILLIGTYSTDHVFITPVKAGPDVVSIIGTGRNANYKVFVSPAIFPESGAAALPAEEGKPAEILFLNIPWGTSFPDAKSILEGQGKKVKSPAQRNDHLRAQIESEIEFGNCVATNAALDFSYEAGVSDYKEKNSLFKGILYFEKDMPFDQLRLAVKSVYGLDNGSMNGDECTWKKDEVNITLTKKDRYMILEIEKVN
jgi:hypothetical protein